MKQTVSIWTTTRGSRWSCKWGGGGGGCERGKVVVPNARPCSRRVADHLLDQLLRLEVSPKVQHLPGGQSEQAAHAEHAEDEHPVVGGLVRVAHLFLAFSHYRERLHDRIGQVLQSLQIYLEGLQFGCFAVLKDMKRWRLATDDGCFRKHKNTV